MILLPWPPAELSPNSRKHWRAKAPIAKQYRADCGWLTKASGVRVDWDGLVYAWIEFIPPDRRHRDDDNMIGSFKSGRDGIADALGINDKRIRTVPWVSDTPTKGGAVRVVLLQVGPGTMLGESE